MNPFSKSKLYSQIASEYPSDVHAHKTLFCHSNKRYFVKRLYLMLPNSNVTDAILLFIATKSICRSILVNLTKYDSKIYNNSLIELFCNHNKIFA